ncbi:hypothetical protein I7I53_10167 [Histoplasma capsulatum var. duboisii H88]|uniref:Uncharacterized protein n=1 Tax=Ajellomyces capsulatus (strain H88) TaxID=544711 RepID=A0A8A1LAA3_AJEC8|nr:hypothetical protein I7I53_10167 [Histoplasma capsulatum var. duboisii H88]
MRAPFSIFHFFLLAFICRIELLDSRTIVSISWLRSVSLPFISFAWNLACCFVIFVIGKWACEID